MPQIPVQSFLHGHMYLLVKIIVSVSSILESNNGSWEVSVYYLFIVEGTMLGEVLILCF